jgi:hypothetical protein
MAARRFAASSLAAISAEYRLMTWISRSVITAVAWVTGTAHFVQVRIWARSVSRAWTSSASMRSSGRCRSGPAG